jgi:hypothetical protein
MYPSPLEKRMSSALSDFHEVHFFFFNFISSGVSLRDSRLSEKAIKNSQKLRTITLGRMIRIWS